MSLARDLPHPSLEEEKKKHKKKRLVQSPNSYFMDVKCPGCYKITMVFRHAQRVVLCASLQAERLDSQKVAHLEESNTNDLNNFLNLFFHRNP